MGAIHPYVCGLEPCGKAAPCRPTKLRMWLSLFRNVRCVLPSRESRVNDAVGVPEEKAGTGNRPQFRSLGGGCAPWFRLLRSPGRGTGYTGGGFPDYRIFMRIRPTLRGKQGAGSFRWDDCPGFVKSVGLTLSVHHDFHWESQNPARGADGGILDGE